VSRRVAITGAAGQLGRELVRAFSGVGDHVLALARPQFDITDASHVDRLRDWRPDIVVNSAAWTDVDGCARDPERAMQINGEAPGALARAAAAVDALMVQISTNEVFDGALERPYREEDARRPINPYAASKLRGEELVAAGGGRHAIVRTAWLFGGPVSFPEKIRAAARRMIEEGRPLRVVDDEWGNPTDVRWLGPAVERLIAVPGPRSIGAIHLAGWPPTTRRGWAAHVLADVPVAIEPIAASDYPRASRVPLRAVLDVERARRLGIEPADWESAAPLT